jgi:endogenous inhibitor of DNA gyrase (YacG/DUF329 family)
VTRLVCECETPELVLDADRRTVHCHKCGKSVVDSQVAQVVRLVQVALGNGIGLDEATLDALAERLQGQPASAGVDVGADPVLALPRPQAAKALGMGPTSFDKYVRPYVPVVRRGTLRCYPVDGLKRWLDENADLALASGRERG